MRMWLLVVLALLLSGRTASGQVQIELKSFARVAANTPVRLGDIATISGPDSAQFAEFVIELDALARGKWAKVSVDQIRTALNARGISWATTTLSGSACTLGRIEASPRVKEPTHEADDEASHVEPANTKSPPGTLGALVEAYMAELLAVMPQNLRLTFDDRDASLLAMQTSGLVIDVQPLGTSDRMPLAVTLYRGEQIVLRETVAVEVLIRREVTVATTVLGRGEIMRPEHVSRDEQWLPPGTRTPTLETVLGSAVHMRLKAGQVICDRDLVPPIVVRRGERVRVHCISGGVILIREARALKNARDGELVEFEPVRGDQTFFARMSGPGRAVAVAESIELQGGEPNATFPSGEATR